MNNCKKDHDNGCNTNQGINNAMLIIVLFILLAIIFSGYFAY